MRILQRLLPAALIAAAVLGGCAVSDGGIVGSGNRTDCETARKDGGSLPPECK